MPHSNVDTTPGNKKGLLLNYDVADRNRKERGGFEGQQTAAIGSNGADAMGMQQDAFWSDVNRKC
jgi:hypothetical protein